MNTFESGRIPAKEGGPKKLDKLTILITKRITEKGGTKKTVEASAYSE